ncbi:hypothetical protein Bca4012_061674 [Brassica carinata]
MKGPRFALKVGFTPKKVMEFGNPKEAICNAVEKLGVDLLIVGSHGKGALERELSLEVLATTVLTRVSAQFLS